MKALTPKPARGLVIALLEYAVVFTLALFAVALDYDLGRNDWTSPLCYLIGGDGAYFAGMHFKGIADAGNYLDNPFLGAPGAVDLRDFPAPDLAYVAIIRIATLATPSWVVAYNAVLVLGFPLVALAAYYVLKRFGVGTVAALAASLLYAFLPFHHHRLFGHPHLAFSYFEVPFGALLALSILREEEVLLVPRPGGLLPRIAATRASLAIVLVCVFVGVTGQVYYTFFAVFVLVAAGLVAAVRARSLLPAWRAGAMLGVTLAAFLAQTAPFLLHARAHGKVPLSERYPADSEFFGLKIAELLLPQTNHRFEAVRAWRKVYDLTAPLVNENVTSYLGLVGGAGFLVLVVALLVQRRLPGAGCPGEHERPLLHDLAVLNAVAVLLGTIGGFGALVAYAGFPEVRSYNRISVVVGFYSISAVALLLDRAVAVAARRGREDGAVIAIAVLTVLGIYETSFEGTPDYPNQGRRWAEDGAFAAAMDRALPEGAAVFELPHMRFPEGGNVNQLEDYALLVPYLHTKKLRWSYGAMRGRRVDAWLSGVQELPPEKMVEALVHADFSGIYVGRYAYADHGAKLEADLTRLVGPPVVVASNGVGALFSLTEYGARLRAGTGEEEWQRKSDAVARPVFLGFFDGFYPIERWPEHSRVVSRRRGRITIENPARTTRRVKFEAMVRSGKGPASLRVRSALFEGDFPIAPGTPTHIERTFEVPPGEHTVSLECDGDAVDDPREWRKIVFVLEDPVVREVDPATP